MLAFIAPSPSVDVTYVVKELRIGQGHRPVSVHKHAGGKALNAARAAARMGTTTQAVAVLAGASGSFIADQLMLEGVKLCEIRGSHDTRTCISIASNSDSTLTEVYEHASSVTAAEWSSVREAVQDVLSLRPSWMAVSGSLPASLDPTVLAELTQASQEKGVPFAVDTHGAALVEVVAAKPALIKVNRAEASAFLGSEELVDVLELATAIQTMSAGKVIVTDGTEGAAATDGERSWRIPAPMRFGGFPVGSGDAFLGGLLSALDAGHDFSDGLKLGAGCSVANALQPGAGNFNSDTAREFADAIHLLKS